MKASSPRALIELGESMASELKLSSKTAAKFKEVVLDNKEAFIQAVSSGSVKPETIIQQLSTNFLKNATTEEHEEFVKLYFEGKMPEHQANIIETIQDAKEKKLQGRRRRIFQQAAESLLSPDHGRGQDLSGTDEIFR